MSEPPGPPLFAGTILGLRAWVIQAREDEWTDEVCLGSYFAEGTWALDASWTVASCDVHGGLWEPHRRDRQHTPPGHQCTCGLYAWHPDADAAQVLWDEHLELGPAPDPCHPETSGVAGVIEACGRVEVHRSGFRAERARVKTLLVGRDWPAEMVDRVRCVADLYRAELVTLARPDELVAYCREQGSALSSEQVRELVGPEGESYEQILRKGGSRYAPTSAPARVPPPPAGPIAGIGRGLKKVGEWIGVAVLVVAGVLFYGGIASAIVALVGGILFGWFDTGPKPPPAARVTEVRVDRERCLVAARVSARKPVDELTVRATGRDASGRGLGHLTDTYGPIARGGSWIQVGELTRKLCRALDPFTVRVRAIFPGRVGAPASVTSTAGQKAAATGDSGER